MIRGEGVQVLSYRRVLASRVRNVQENEGVVSPAVEPQRNFFKNCKNSLAKPQRNLCRTAMEWLIKDCDMWKR